MSSLFTKCILISSAAMLFGCATTEKQYSSNQRGPVDCKDFPMQSDRKDIAADNEGSCQVITADNVEVVGAQYARYLESNSGYMLTSLLVAGPTTFFYHRETQALLNDIPFVRKEAVDWEDLPTTEFNGRTYKLKSFSLYKVKHDCIGYTSYGNSFSIGYSSVLYGYSCKPQTMGKMQVADIRKDLDALRVRM